MWILHLFVPNNALQGELVPDINLSLHNLREGIGLTLTMLYHTGSMYIVCDWLTVSFLISQAVVASMVEQLAGI